MTGSIKIFTERLELRQLEPAAAQLVLDYQLANREFSKKWTPHRPEEFYTLPLQRALLDQSIAERSKNIRFHLFDKGDHSRIIGDLAFNNIVYGPFCSCHAGYGILGERQGEGLMTEALAAGVKYMFEEIGLHRIQANVIPSNIRSINVLERLKFKREGRHDKYLKIDGHWQDHLSYAIINNQ